MMQLHVVENPWLVWRHAGCAVESVAEDEIMRILILLRNFIQGALSCRHSASGATCTLFPKHCCSLQLLLE